MGKSSEGLKHTVLSAAEEKKNLACNKQMLLNIKDVMVCVRCFLCTALS